MYIGTDALALAPFTKRVTYLEDDDWVVLNAKGATIFQGRKEVQREIRQSGISGAMMGKGNHRHFMVKEIYEQPAVIGDTLQTYLDPATRKVTLPALPFDWAKVSRLTITACGTACFAGMVAKYWFEKLARLPVEVEVASEFRYREPPLPEGGVCIAISQSGETIDTLAALRYAKAQQADHPVGGQRAGERDRPRIARRAADAGRPRDRRRLDQGLHDAAHRAAGGGDRRRPGARRAVGRGGGAAGQRADRAAGAPQRGAEPRGAVPAHRRGHPRRGARRALPRAAARPSRSRSRAR